MKLNCNVMGTDCTAGGLTSGKESVVLETEYNVREPADDTGYLVLEAYADLPACKKGCAAVPNGGSQGLRVIARPVGKPAGMFGGHFIYSSDSRFPFSTPIKVYDRYEA